MMFGVTPFIVYMHLLFRVLLIKVNSYESISKQLPNEIQNSLINSSTIYIYNCGGYMIFIN